MTVTTELDISVVVGVNLNLILNYKGTEKRKFRADYHAMFSSNLEKMSFSVGAC